MEWLNVWFGLAVLAYIGLIFAMWRFWHPQDPLRRNKDQVAPTRQSAGTDQLGRLSATEGLYLLDDETLLQKGEASLYSSRDDTPVIGGAVRIAGGGWLFGTQQNRPGYTYQETGTLYLTSQRLLFVGAHQTYSLPLQGLIRMEVERPWLTIWGGQDGKTIRFRVGHPQAWYEAVDLVRTRGPSALAG